MKGGMHNVVERIGKLPNTDSLSQKRITKLMLKKTDKKKRKMK